ncbi:MAG: hypothetical protein AAF725_27580, partial [Acidobacteriota bacterium]
MPEAYNPAPGLPITQVWEPSPEALAQPELRLPIAAPADGTLPFLRRVYAFACEVDQRWLEPEDFADRSKFRSDAREMAEQILNWMAEVRRHRPVFDSGFEGPLKAVDAWQWEAKAELLEALALICWPSARRAPEFRSGKVA